MYNKNIEEYDNKLDEFLYNDHVIGKQKETNFNSFRHKDDYLDIQMELAKYLLKINEL